MTPVRYLGTEDLLKIAGRLGVLDVRDWGLLDSAAMRPQSIIFGNESYPTLHLKAAALMESLIGNHPLVDGNKRLGWAAVVGFYALNDIFLEVDDNEAYDFVIKVASGKLHFPEIAAQLEKWV